MKKTLLGITFFVLTFLSFYCFYNYAFARGYESGHKNISWTTHGLTILGSHKGGLEFYNPYDSESITERINKMGCDGIIIIPPGYEINEQISFKGIPTACSIMIHSLHFGDGGGIDINREE